MIWYDVICVIKIKQDQDKNQGKIWGNNIDRLIFPKLQ